MNKSAATLAMLATASGSPAVSPSAAARRSAGGPAGVLNVVNGLGEQAGKALALHGDVRKITFTGSTAVARLINRTLAQRDGPIVPLIAETGGINAMVVDSTALPEQVVDAVVQSAFRSAGQRCSALRLLCVQEDVAETMIATIAGAARELKLGDPRDPSVHVGPVIDAEAKERLDAHIARNERHRLIATTRVMLSARAEAHAQRLTVWVVCSAIGLAMGVAWGVLWAVVL